MFIQCDYLNNEVLYYFEKYFCQIINLFRFIICSSDIRFTIMSVMYFMTKYDVNTNMELLQRSEVWYF